MIHLMIKVALFVDLYRNETAGSCDELYSYGINVPGQYYLSTHNTVYLVTCFDRGKRQYFKKNIPFYIISDSCQENI